MNSKLKIYVGHASGFDYQHQLYAPLKSSHLWQQHTFLLPHDQTETSHNTKPFISQCDLMLAEVSYPSTGLGIELGWAECAKRKIWFLFQKDCQPSLSLKLLSDHFIEYADLAELILKLNTRFEGLK